MPVLLLLPLVLIPLLAAGICLALGPRAGTSRVTIAALTLTLVVAVMVAAQVVNLGDQQAGGGWLHADGLSALLVCIIAGIALPCAAYGVDYMRHVKTLDHADARWLPGRYEALTLGLVACMMLSAIADNLGLLWIAVEGSTLTSALLVGYYRRPEAVEAGWKYLILCSVGISLALFATVLVFYSGAAVFGEQGSTLRWTTLRDVASQLDPRFVKLAFLFALIGYGTKAGLAPMHSWLPDAYSQAPAPAAALLSTALLATSLAALLRFHAIAVAGVGPEWSGALLTGFGVLSIVVAAPLMLVQDEYKRLLAYSSLEHTGLVALAVGLGTPLALFAGLLHLLVQSLVKALAFLVGGSLQRASGSRRMGHFSGLIEADPRLATLLVFAGLGLVGLPPMGTFASEWMTLAGGFASRRAGATIVALVALTLVFTAITHRFSRIILGKARERFADPLPARTRVPLVALAGAAIVLGVWLPTPVRALIEHAMLSIRR
ncbi:MAG: proton-conducting transporter membrane subunit [Candidatus Eisenbacteria bacterium]